MLAHPILIVAYPSPFAILFHGGSLSVWLRRSSRNANLTRAGAIAKSVERFFTSSIDGLDAPRSEAPRTIEDARIEALIVKTLENVPKNAIHWSSRGIAKASGLSTSSGQRIWRAFGQPALATDAGRRTRPA